MKTTPLEKKFETSLKTVGDSIREKLTIAMAGVNNRDATPAAVQALKDITSLSNKHGIPYHSPVIALGDSMVIEMANHFVPESFFNKYQDLDVKRVSAMTGIASFALIRKKEYDYDEYDEDEFGEDDLDDDGN